jgi:hypothetical protein
VDVVSKEIMPRQSVKAASANHQQTRVVGRVPRASGARQYWAVTFCGRTYARGTFVAAILLLSAPLKLPIL